MFDTAYICERGGRDVNQDAILSISQDNFHCWALADGLGGMGGGELASAAAIEAIEAAFLAAPAISRNALVDCLTQANRQVQLSQTQTPAFASMRTTAVLLLSDGAAGQWAHCGDSRLYHFRDGVIAAQTLDHSVPQVLVAAGRIDASAIRGHADRNRILKSLGGVEAPDLTLSESGLQSGDAFLLASDGFWELVTEREMEAERSKAATAQAWLAGMIARLATRLLETPGADNYSAIAILRR